MRGQAEEIAEQVVASFSECEDPRLRELMQALATHLHAFARATRLTPDEWAKAMTVLAKSGDLTEANRQEFILWSDALGLSMAVEALSDQRDPRATESTVEGPFHAPHSPLRAFGSSISEIPSGEPAWINGRVLNIDGEPIDKAELDVWQNAPNRLYAVQDSEAPDHHLRGRFLTGSDGSYALLGIRPTPYQIPDDGPVGAMLRATNRHAWRPAHIHIAVSAAGYQPLVTHIFDADSPYLDSDAVFAVKPSLIRQFEEHHAEDPERPIVVAGKWTSVEVDFVLDRLRACPE